MLSREQKDGIMDLRLIFFQVLLLTHKKTNTATQFKLTLKIFSRERI